MVLYLDIKKLNPSLAVSLLNSEITNVQLHFCSWVVQVSGFSSAENLSFL